MAGAPLGTSRGALAVSVLDDPEHRAVQRTFTHGNRRDSATLLAQAQRDGYARPDVNPDELLEMTPGAAVLPLHVHRRAGRRRGPPATSPSASGDG